MMPPAGRHRLRFLLPLLVVLASGASLASSAVYSPPSPFLGIAPQDEQYFASDVIACRDGSKSFRRDRLNDGFCDCPDGTDEPGTSACPESKFYCRNIGDKPELLFSSRVNDHICDCCDGSDEYDGSISCPNACSKDAEFFKGSATYDLAGRKFSQINAEQSEKRVDSEDLISRLKESEGRKFSQINAREREKRVDSEDLISRLKELRVAVFVELFIAACVIASCLFHRHARTRRRRHWYRN